MKTIVNPNPDRTQTKKKYRSGLLWQIPVLCALLLWGGLEAHAAGQLKLFVGQVKIMKTGPVARVAVGNGKLLSTTIFENGQLVVLAESEGVTDLHIWRNNGREDHYTVDIAKDNTRGQTHQNPRTARDRSRPFGSTGGRFYRHRGRDR